MNTLRDIVTRMFRRALPPSGALAIVVCLHAQAATAQEAVFYPMGTDYPGNPNVIGNRIVQVGNSGVVLGFLTVAPSSGNYGYTWTAKQSYEYVSGLEKNDLSVTPIDVDQSGRYMVGQVVPFDNSKNIPVIWIDREPFQLFDLPPSHNAIAHAISWDSLTIVGAYTVFPVSNESFLVEDRSILTLLGNLPGGTGSGLNSVSGDGTIASGAGSVPTGQMSALWTRKQGWEGLGDLTGAPPYFSSFRDMSSDGRVAVGRSLDENGNMRMVRWTRYHGWQDLGNGGSIDAVSGDGFVAGTRTNELGSSLWNPRDGWRSLREILEVDHGLTIDWIHLGTVQAISDNGQYVAGGGANANNELESFLVKLPPFCYADCNADKKLDIMDYLCFIDEYDNESVYANCNNDGAMNILDYICFGDAFAAGCP